jgi:hypothetical protein
MVRRYDDAIDVRMNDVRQQDGQVEHVRPGDGLSCYGLSRGGGGGSSVGDDLVPAQPTAFLWRGRLYVVRAVQTRWYERRAWWREAAAAALLGLRGDDASAGSSARASSGTVTEVLDTTEYLDGETEVWRVEAAAGRSCPVGVFDLARSMSTAPGGAPGGWRLTRVAD